MEAAHLWRDLRHAVRALATKPLPWTMAIGSVGVATALVTVSFALIRVATVQGLPYSQPEELVHFEIASPGGDRPDQPVTPHDYVAWREEQTTFADLAAFTEAEAVMLGSGLPSAPVPGVAIEPAGFALLGARPQLGRSLHPADAEPGAAPAVVLSDRLWKSQFGADPGIVGRRIEVDGLSEPWFTVVGVMAPGFGFPVAEQFWVPLRIDLAEYVRGQGRLDVFGRLASGRTLADAQAEFQILGERLARAFPDTNAGTRPKLASLSDEFVGPAFRDRAVTIGLGALLVLVIAGSNLVNVFLARAQERESELALRTALGASRARLSALVGAETLVVTAIALALGLGMAAAGLDWLTRALVASGALALPHGDAALAWWQFSLDGPTIAAAVFATCVVTTLAGLLASARATSVSLRPMMASGARATAGPRVHRVMRGLVGAQLAVTVVLLTALSLAVRSGLALEAEDFGLPLESRTARVALLAEERRDPARRAAFWRGLLEALEAHPAIDQAALASHLPLERARPTPVSLDAAPADERPPLARGVLASPGFFAALGGRVRAGRDFDRRDDASGAPVVIVNESFVRERFAEGDALGRAVRVHAPWGDGQLRTIVGVVDDLWIDGENPGVAGVYLPMAQLPPSRVAIVASSSRLNAAEVDAAVSAAARANGASVAVYAERALGELAAERTGRYGLYGQFFLAFGLIAVLIATTGLHAVVTLTVSGRLRDYAVHAALGADRAALRRHVWRSTRPAILVGLAVGVPVALGLASGISSTLFRTESYQAASVVGAGILMMATAWLAALGPARRASRVDPVRALRADA